MRSAILRRGLVMAALSAAAVLAGCETGPTKAEIEAARIAAEAAAAAARRPPPVALNDSVAQSAAVYLAFTRDMATVRGGFADAEAIQAALRRGSAYDPVQLSRGLVSYASILALQSPEFVAGVQQYSIDPATRQKVISDIVADPGYASTLPGAEAAAALIFGALSADINALSQAANSVEQDAYTIQSRSDPRRAWAVAHITDRVTRLEQAKTASVITMQGSPEEAASLLAAATSGVGLAVTPYASPHEKPYPAAVNNALALAALAALGAAGENARANTDALQNDPTSQFCLNMSKLNLYQCLAASRPSYEDMFCVGRHVVRDLATCTRGAAMPAPIVTVSDPVTLGPARPSIVTAPLDPEPTAQTPVQTPAPTVAPAPAISPTARLNTTPGS